MNANARTNRRRLWLPMLTAAGLVILTGADSARAGHRHRTARRSVGRVWVEPIYETRARTVAVPAVFESRTRQVWHEPVYETQRVSVEIPAEIGQRRVPRYSEYGQLIGYNTADEVIQAARTVQRFEEVLVHPGHYETVYDRVLVRRETTRLVMNRFWSDGDTGSGGDAFTAVRAVKGTTTVATFPSRRAREGAAGSAAESLSDAATESSETPPKGPAKGRSEAARMMWSKQEGRARRLIESGGVPFCRQNRIEMVCRTTGSRYGRWPGRPARRWLGLFG